MGQAGELIQTYLSKGVRRVAGFDETSGRLGSRRWREVLQWVWLVGLVVWVGVRVALITRPDRSAATLALSLGGGALYGLSALIEVAR